VVENGFVRRTPRYSLIVDAEIADILLKAQIKTQTKMLSLFGCGVASSKLFSRGTNVRIKLSHKDAEVTALARVVYSSLEMGMGFAFTSVEREHERILEGWIAEYLSVSTRE
jgi:PilZ domain